MHETRDDVGALDTPQDITHEMTSTQVPRRSGKIVRPPIRFIGLVETSEAIPEEAELDPHVRISVLKSYCMMLHMLLCMT